MRDALYDLECFDEEACEQLGVLAVRYRISGFERHSGAARDDQELRVLSGCGVPSPRAEEDQVGTTELDLANEEDFEPHPEPQAVEKLSQCERPSRVISTEVDPATPLSPAPVAAKPGKKARRNAAKKNKHRPHAPMPPPGDSMHRPHAATQRGTMTVHPCDASDVPAPEPGDVRPTNEKGHRN